MLHAYILGAHAQARYTVVCLCVCVCVCLSACVDCYSCSRINEEAVSHVFLDLIRGFAKECLVLRVMPSFA